MELFKKTYDGESIVDVGRDVFEAFDKDFNPPAAAIPQDDHGFQQGEFVVTIEWVPNKAIKLILASASFTAGLFIGAAILLPILAHAAEYTAVGRDNTGEMVLVEFDETDKHGNLAGLMWRRLEVFEVDGRWCGKGLARFDDVRVEVVK